MKLRIEQVGKGGLPPLFPDHLDWARAGVNHPSRLVQFECLFFLPGDFRVSKKEQHVYSSRDLTGRRSVGARCERKTNMSLLTERATRLDMLVYKHAAPPEQTVVSQIYDYC